MSIERIRDALAAGPTPGEWFAVNDGTRGEPFMNVKAERISGRGPTHEVAICATGDSPQSMETANARYIAACHPAAIRELLAERDALAVENERLRGLIDAHNADCIARCEAMSKQAGHAGVCIHYTNRGRTCPNCPRDEMIDAARGKE